MSNKKKCSRCGATTNELYEITCGFKSDVKATTDRESLLACKKCLKNGIDIELSPQVRREIMIDRGGS
ncbi:MAG: hypothetical protein NC452_05930 [Eubacterium sp.]|nr:hypothetical protein [Eubacterium sp.]